MTTNLKLELETWARLDRARLADLLVEVDRVARARGYRLKGTGLSESPGTYPRVQLQFVQEGEDPALKTRRVLDRELRDHAQRAELGRGVDEQ